MRKLLWSISSNFGENSLFTCASQPKTAKNSLKTRYFRFQGRSRSSMLVPPKRSSAVLVMISSKSASICNRFHARQAINSGKIRFLRGYLSLLPLFEGNLLTQRHEICSQEARDSTLSYSENPESISPGLESVPGRDRRTDGRTDRITIASIYIRAKHYVLSRVKTKDARASWECTYTCFWLS